MTDEALTPNNPSDPTDYFNNDDDGYGGLASPLDAPHEGDDLQADRAWPAYPAQNVGRIKERSDVAPANHE